MARLARLAIPRDNPYNPYVIFPARRIPDDCPQVSTRYAPNNEDAHAHHQKYALGLLHRF
jgi:hypothetical protein